MISQNYDWIVEGEYIDAKDKHNDWQVALVTSKAKSMIKVRFDGWSSKYDEFFPMSSNKIRPFRSVIRGYTGQRISPGVREHWKFNSDHHKEKMEKFSKFVAELNTKSEREIQQFLRGQNYFYIDFLMTVTYTNKEDLNLVLLFFKDYIRFVKKYLDEIVQHGLNEWRNYFQKIQDIQKRDAAKQYTESYFQILDSINSITGTCTRHFGFFKNNDKLIKQIVAPDATYEMFMSKFFVQICFYDTFSKLLTLCVAALNKQKMAFEFPFLKSIFHLFCGIQKLNPNKEEKKKQVSIFFQLIKHEMDRIEVNHVKLFEKQIDNLFADMKLCFFKFAIKDKVYEWVDEAKIKIWILMIKSDILEKKLRGLLKIKEYFESTIIQGNQNEMGEVLATENLSKLLHNQQFFKLVFQDNEHPQILKKSAQLLCIFYKYFVTDLRQAFHVWTSCAHKHETIRKIVYQLWTDMINVIRKQDFQQFLQVVLKESRRSLRRNIEIQENQTPKILKDDWELQFIFSFTSTLIRSFEESEDVEVVKLIKRCVPELLEVSYSKILESEQSLVFQTLVISFAKMVASTTTSDPIVQTLFNQIEKKSNFKTNVQILTEVFRESKGKQIFVPENAIKIIYSCLKSQINEKEMIQRLFKLINEVMNAKSKLGLDMQLDESQFIYFWNLFSQFQNAEIRSIFYTWMMKRSTNSFEIDKFEINAALSEDLIKHIFQNILTDSKKFDYINMTLQELQLFLQFMIVVNKNENKIQEKVFFSDKKIIKINQLQIEGYKNLWDIFLNCKNFEVIEELASYMMSFNFNFSDSIALNLRKSKIQALLNKLEKYIKDGYKKSNIKLMKHSLLLLKKIVHMIKEKSGENSIKNHNIKGNIKVFKEGNNVPFDLEVNLSQNFHSIKTKIGNHFGMQDKSKFYIKTIKNEQITRELLNLPYFCLQEKILRVCNVKQTEETIQKFVLNFMKQKIEETLIEMLQNQSICEDVYVVLEELDLCKSDGQNLLNKLQIMLQKVSKYNRQDKKNLEGVLQKQEIYINLFYLKVLLSFSEEKTFLIDYIKTTAFNQLIAKLHTQIENELLVKLLSEIAETLLKIYKKVGYSQDESMLSQQIASVLHNYSETVRQNCFGCIIKLINYLNSKSNAAQKSKPKEIKLFISALNLIQININHQNLVSFLLGHHNIQVLLNSIFVMNSKPEIRIVFAEKIKKYLNKMTLNSNLPLQIQLTLIKTFLKDLYLKIRQQEQVGTSKSEIISNHVFYKLISFLITKLSKPMLDAQIFKANQNQTSLTEKIISVLKRQKDSVQMRDPVNFVLEGHLQILHSIYQKCPELINHEIINFIINECLFFNENKKIDSTIDVKCKKTQTIKAALEILFTICKNSEQGQQIEAQAAERLNLVLSSIHQYHKIDFWRNSNCWNTVVEEEVRGEYVGLQNPGCICYLNSLMQQLFMIEEFRNSVLGLDLSEDDKPELMDLESGQASQVKSKEQNKIELLSSLKELFLRLSKSQEIAVNPVFFTKSIKNAQNKPMIKIFQQMDIDEFSSILFDRMEQAVPFLKNSKNFVKQHFGGIYAHQIISKQCVHSSQREQQFFTISLDVKKNILQSFNSLVQSETLDGQNKYYCERCDKKVKAQKGLTLKRLPKNLILSLKRFQFDYEVDAKIKINDYCEFPKELNLQDFSQQQMNKKLVSEESNLAQQIDENDEKRQKQLSAEHFIYKLKGVVVHTGSADSGHYYSFIEDKNKNWFQFNDERVSPFDLQRLAEETYGGKDDQDVKIKNAYLIFYERINKEPEEMQVEQNSELCLYDKQQNKEILKLIEIKNKKINKFRLLFSKDYSHFVDKIRDEYLLRYDISQTKTDFFLSYYLLIRLREGNLSQIIYFSNFAKEQTLRNSQFRQNIIKIFQSQAGLEQFFTYCSNRDKSKLLGSIILEAIKSTLLSNQNIDLIQSLLQNFMAFTVIQGNVHQLLLILRKLVQWEKQLPKERVIWNPSISSKLFQCNLACYLLDNVLGYNNNKEERQAKLQSLNHKDNNEGCVQIIGQALRQGRKFNPTDEKQAYHLLLLLLEKGEEYANCSNSQDENLKHNALLLTKLQNKINLIKPLKMAPLIFESSHTKSVITLGQFFLKYCQEHSQFTQVVLGSIQKALKDYEATKYRQFLLLSHKLIQSQDEQQPKRIHSLISIFRSSLKINEKYFVECDLIHQWILKFCSTCALFLTIFQTYPQFIEQILQWSNARKLPNAQILKKHKIPTNERYLQRLHGIHISADPKDYDKYTKFKIREFESIKHNQYSSIQAFSEPNIEEDYSIGRSVQYQYILELFSDGQNWLNCEVIENNFSLLRIRKLNLQSGQKQADNECYIWQDSERVRVQLQQEWNMASSSNENRDLQDEDEDLYN